MRMYRRKRKSALRKRRSALRNVRRTDMTKADKKTMRELDALLAARFILAPVTGGISAIRIGRSLDAKKRIREKYAKY